MRRPATDFEPHRDGNRFHVRCLNGEMQVFAKELEHIAMCPTLPVANMVADALNLMARIDVTADGVHVLDNDLVWTWISETPIPVRDVNRLTSVNVITSYSTEAARDKAENDD